MRQFIFAKKDCWLTQSEVNVFRPRIFLKMIPVNYPESWTEWTNKQKEDYEAQYGKMKPTDIIAYYNNFDYSTTGGFWGEIKRQS